jgi:hypothetical protein
LKSANALTEMQFSVRGVSHGTRRKAKEKGQSARIAERTHHACGPQASLPAHLIRKKIASRMLANRTQGCVRSLMLVKLGLDL